MFMDYVLDIDRYSCKFDEKKKEVGAWVLPFDA